MTIKGQSILNNRNIKGSRGIKGSDIINKINENWDNNNPVGIVYS